MENENGRPKCGKSTCNNDMEKVTMAVYSCIASDGILGLKTMEMFMYETLSSALAPFVFLNLWSRRWRGLEHPERWRERLGYASLSRPSGTLLWFHAVSIGEGLAAIPIIEKFIQMRPALNILMTTATVTAFRVLKSSLPQGVLCQFVPVDTPAAVKRFLVHWHPQAGIFMESELWPNLLLQSAAMKIPMALLNARISEKSLRRWLHSAARPLISEMLKNFRVICPLSNEEGTRLQLLGASPAVIHFAGNSKYAWEGTYNKVEDSVGIKICGRKVWLASSTHPGEEEVIARVHLKLSQHHQRLLTIIAPRHIQRAYAIIHMLRKMGLKVAQRSNNDKINLDTDIYLADTLGELRNLYSTVPIAFVGGSLIKGLGGHNIAEAAACGCAVLTGPYIGHFEKMVTEMREISPLSIHQVFSEDELTCNVEEFLCDENKLQICREAAKEASKKAAVGVVQRMYSVLELHICIKP